MPLEIDASDGTFTLIVKQKAKGQPDAAFVYTLNDNTGEPFRLAAALKDHAKNRADYLKIANASRYGKLGKTK